MTCIVPSIGRGSLARTLASIRAQAPPAELELLVVGDSHGNDFAEALAAVPALCAHYGARYLEYGDHPHAWGLPQRNAGMSMARGQWLAFSADDDVWTPDAWAAIREAITSGEPMPCLFKVKLVWAGITVWQTRDVRCGNLDADGLCFPNEPARLGQFTDRYQGDYDMAVDTIALWKGQVRWVDHVIAVARPDGH